MLVEPNQVDTQFEIILPSDGLNEIFGNTNTQRQSNPVFSQINLERNAKKISYISGVAQYTFALHNPIVSARNSNSQYTTDNLSVKVNPDGSYSTYIFRYIPDMSWFNIYDNTIDSYTGEIQLLTTDGDILNEFSLVNGEPTTNNTTSRSSARSTSACDIIVSEICVDLIHPDGYSSGLDCVITYNVSCSGGGNYPGGGVPSNPDRGDDNPSGGGGNGGGVSTNPILGTCLETNTCEEEEQIINNLTDPCAKAIFTELENGLYVDDILSPEMQVPISNPNDILNLNFSESILFLFNNSDNTHLIIQNGNTGSSNASTVGATITIGNDYLASATELSIARTMIHESVHAYINALYSNVISFNSFSFREKIEKYAEDNGYTIGTNLFHHNFMGQFVDAMAYSLYEWDKEYGSGGNLGWNYYQSMVYSGMFQVDPSGNIATEIDTFIELVPNASDRQAIADIILNEQNGNNEAQGTTCD